MKIHLLGAACALALGLNVWSLLAADSDTMKSDMGMSPKMSGSSSDMKDTKKSDMGMSSTMAGSASEKKASKLYVVQCGSPCDFEVKSHDKDEAIAVALNHLKTHHHMTDATAKDVEAMVKVVEPGM
ncbi:MAG TPA: hypothetical protein VLW52_00760 [Opitutaceae bacterium]|nr:hypothetical protein [Opitutaceae bacterium]